jgi:hypothetical protein
MNIALSIYLQFRDLQIAPDIFSVMSSIKNKNALAISTHPITICQLLSRQQGRTLCTVIRCHYQAMLYLTNNEITSHIQRLSQYVRYCLFFKNLDFVFSSNNNVKLFFNTCSPSTSTWWKTGWLQQCPMDIYYLRFYIWFKWSLNDPRMFTHSAHLWYVIAISGSPDKPC